MAAPKSSPTLGVEIVQPMVSSALETFFAAPGMLDSIAALGAMLSPLALAASMKVLEVRMVLTTALFSLFSDRN